jgi:CheY-like chemotaxis protein
MVSFGGVIVHRGKLVLIVDDHEVIRNTLRSRFEFEGFQVSVAENGAEGVAKAEALKPDLIIMDLAMPVMNGLDAAKALRIRMPTIPIVMFTNMASPILEEQNRKVGITALFSKEDGSCKLIEKAKELLN